MSRLTSANEPHPTIITVIIDEDSKTILARFIGYIAFRSYRFRLLFPCRHRGTHTLSARFTSGSRRGSGTTGLLSTHWRAHTVDECALLRHAYLSDGTLLRQPASAQGGGKFLSSVVAGERVVCVCLSPWLLHPSSCLRFPKTFGCARLHRLGVQQLLFHHNRSRTHLESDSPGLLATDDCGHSAGLSGQVPVGIRRHSHLHCSRNPCQPCADDLLLHVYHRLHGARLPR